MNSTRNRLEDGRTSGNSALIELVNVHRRYRGQGETVHALRDVCLSVNGGDFVAVIGPSGSGKSTLLHLIGCLDRPDEGTYRLAGRDTATLTRDELAEARNRRIGFVFQSYRLMPRMAAWENVALPLIYRGYGWSEARRAAEAALKEVAAAELAERRPPQLSGGQQQRLAIARAIVGRPDIILADEPTGSLERGSGAAIMEIFRELHRKGQTVMVITHDPAVAGFADRLLNIEDGRVADAGSMPRDSAP